MVQIEKKQIFHDVSNRTHASRQAADTQQHPESQAEDSKESELPSVAAALTFMINTGTRPYIETEALTGDALPHYHARTEERAVLIHDARPLVGHLSLDREGLELRHHITLADDLYDDIQVRRDYYPEVEALVREATGASRVAIFDHTRRRDVGADGKNARQPAVRAHNDYTEKSGPQRMIEVLGADGPARQRAPFAQINVWRPIRGPVTRSPLAVMDASSLDPNDLVTTDMLYPGRTGEIYHLAYNPGQRWFYFPGMERSEAILIKGFDSRTDGRARFAPHTAFTDPGSRPDDPPRESIEVRTFAFFE